MVCNGQQVTDTVCTFSCNIGYDLTGSTSRTCLPDHTWSGEETFCPPLECDELTATYGPGDLQIVIAPCIATMRCTLNVLSFVLRDIISMAQTHGHRLVV